MNKIFKVIWSKSKQCYIVVSEMAKNHSGKKKIVVASILAAMAVGADMSAYVHAVDEGTAKPGGIALGSGSFAGSDGSIALGKKSYAVGTQRDGTTDPSIAIGQRAVAIGNSSLAVGLDTDIRNSYAVAVGRYATVNGDYGIGMGFKSVATEHATAVGESARSKKMGAAAYGVSARGYSQGGVAIGIQSLAGANTFNADGTPKTFIWDDDETTISNYQKFGDVSIGLRTMATGGNATALGRSAAATAANSIAIGGGDGNKLDDNKERTQASAEKAAAIGYSAFASGTSASALGTKAKASAENAAAIGTGAKASANDAFAAGTGAEASEANATALGKGASAEKADAIAIGTGATSGGTSGIAMGNDAQAQAKDTIAVGSSSRASNDNDSAFGNAATAAGSGSTAIGYQANTTAANSTAIGAAAQSTKASATALGNGAKAFSTSGIAIGEGATVGIAEGRTTAGTTPAVDASNSIAIGKNAKVLAGSGSIALGANTQITASDVATSSGSAQKTYPYMLTNTQGTDAVADKENGIVAIGTKRSSTDTGFARRLTGVAGGVNDYDAVNLKQAKAIESSLKSGERHIKATSYTPNAAGTITLNYVNGENKDVTETATITDVAKKSDEWTLGIKTTTTTGTKTTSSVSNITPTAPSGSTKKVISLEAGKNIAIDANGNNVKISTTGLDFLSVKSDATANKVMEVRSDITLKTNRDNDGATGQHSVAIGAYAEARNLSSTAIGNEVVAANNYATALGYNIANSGEGSVAIGKRVNVDKSFATTIGYHQNTTGNASASVNIGYQSTVKANQSVGLGSTINIEDKAQYSTAIGYKAKTLDKNAIAIGSSNDQSEVIAGGESSIAIGTSAQAKANHSVAIGTSAKVLGGQGSVAIGWGTEIGENEVTLSNKVPDAQKTYAYLLDKSSEDAANDAGNGIVAIGKKRSSGDGQTIARRLTGLAGAVGDYDAVNLKQLKALESNEWLLRTQSGENATPTDVTPASVQGETKKRVTLKAGDNIAIENNNGTVTIKAKDVVTSITSGNTTALTVNPSNGAVTITPNIASAVGAANEEGKLVTSGIVKTALDAKIDKTAEMHIKTGEYTVGTDGNASLIQQNGNNQDQSARVVIKDIAKKSVVDGINTTVGTHTTQISNLTTAVEGKVSQTEFDNFKGKAITFTGDDNQGVARTLDTTLTVKGGANYTSTTLNTNIQVAKDGAAGANGLLVKLSDTLTGIKSIAGDEKNNLIIKNGTNTVTITPGKDNNKGTVNFGDAKVIASNLEADITYRANSVADTAANTVKLKKGLNFVAATDATTAAEGPKAGLSITTGADGLVTFGLDKATREKVDNAADKNLSNLSDDGKGKVTELAKAAAKETVKVADGINTTVDTDTTTTEGVTTYKVNANDTKVAITGDGLAISGGDLGATNRVREYTLDLSATTKGKLTAVGNLASVIGGTTITADGTVTGPTFNITNAAGGTDSTTTLKDAIDKLNKTNEGQNTTISNLTTTVTNNYNDLSTKITNAGTAATAAATTKGLNFTGDDTTDNGKVHRDLGETLTIKGGENFTRGTSENNIKVVKNNNDLDVKLAENLGNIKEIAGDGKTDLVIKNGTNTVTITPGKDDNKGTVNFGDAKVIASNLEADITYRANSVADTAANTVKLKKGLNFVAATDATTAAEGPKAGLSITTGTDGLVTFGLDKATREKVDNAADKNLSNLSEAGNNKITNLAKAAAKETVKVAPGINTTVDTDTTTTEGVTTYKVNANDTKVAITGDGLAISGGDLGATNRVREYTLDLSATTKGKLTAVGNLANVIGGTTITTDGTVTGPTFNITNAAGGTDTANTLKDAIDKLNTTNAGQNTTISNLTTTVTNNYNDLSTKITNAGTAATAAATAKGLNFTGDDTTDNGKVHRDLGDTLTIKGGENFARGASENNIKVVKTSNDLAVKLAENLGNIKEIAGDGKTDLVIKNGTNTVTITPGKDDNKGTVNFGDAKVIASNLEADITYRANSVADTAANTVKLKKGLNFVAATDATTAAEGPKAGLSITTGADGLVTFGLDKATREKVDNAADKNLSNLSDDGKGKVTELAKAAAKETVKVADGINTTVDTDTTTTEGVTTYKVNANDTKVAITGDGLAISGGDLGATNRVREYTLDLSATTKGKLTAVGNLANVIGGTTIAADGTVTGPTFNITNATGGTDTANTLKDAIDKLNKTNEGQNTTISDLTTTVTNNYNDLSTKITNAGTAATAAATAKGLNFTGDDTTDNGKVHRDLGDTLTIKGGENFARGASENNIKVVKTSNDLAVKLAKNLGNIEEISGDGSKDLVIKNGDTKVTVKAPKDGGKGSIDFGDTKLVTNNLDANIFYKAGTETDKKTVKLQDGFNFVAGTGTVAATTPATGATTTTSPTASTDNKAAKKGIVISTEANGVVNIGLDSDTRSAIDNAASKNYVENALTNLNSTITGNANLNFAGNVTKDAQDKDADKVGLSLATGTLHIKGDATDITTTAKNDTVTIGLTDTTKNKLKAIGNLATVIGGTTINTDGTVTGPTFNITNAAGGTDSATTLKDAIDKLNKTNEGQNTTISNLTTTVTNNYNDLSNKITNAGTAATAAATTKGLNFTGDDTTDNGKVHRDLGETLTIKGGENFTRGTSENNIKVVKNNNDLDVKLAENLGNIKEIAGDGTHDLVIKNGDTKVTVKAPKDGNKGSIDFGDTKLVTNNLDANISYKAGTETDKKTVKLQDGFNFVAGTGTVVPKHLEAGTTSPTEATDSVEPKKGIAISTAANGVVNIGLDSDTRGIIDNAASKDYVTTELANLNTTITGNANLNFAGNVTKDAQDADVAKVGLALATGTLHIKGDATDITTTAKGDTVTIALTSAAQGKLTAVGNLASVIGGTTIAADGTVTGPTFNITNATGGTDSATTLKDAIDKLNKTNEGQNTTISNLTTTVTNNYNDLSNKITNAGTAATAAATTKGLNFTGDDTTDNGKVHRDLGETLTIKGGENFTRGTSENNIKVVKNNNDLDVKLAENLGNIKEIAGDGTHDLVIKNGDTKVTVKAPKDGNKGSIDFGDTKLVTNNLDANISYKAGTETDKKTVKLQDGFNFVAGTGTVVPKHLEAGTTSPTEATDSVEPKKGIAISTAANGVVNIGLDSDTRGIIDNAASKDYVATELANLNTTITGNANLNFAGNVTKDAQDADVAKVGLALATGTLHIKGDTTDITTTAKGDTVTIGLTDATKGKLTAVDGLATVIGGTNITADGTVTGPTFNITKADGTNETASTIKEAIEKLNTTNAGQNTAINNLTNTVNSNYNDLSNKITNAGTAATAAATTKGLNFTGDDTTDNGKVHRDLGETLTIKGGENFTRGTSENNIKVVKNNNDLDVKLAENLGNIKEIAGDGTHDLVIKNGDTKVTVKAPKDGNKGSIDFGDTKLVTNNLDANISYKAGTETDKKTVKLQDGFNFVAGTGTVVPKHLEAGTTSPTEATDSVEPKKGIAISTAANGVVNIGLDSDTRGAIDNAADKNLSNLSEAGNNKITNLAKAAAKETVKVAPGINTTVDTDTTTTEGVTTYKVNANDTKVVITGDGLTISGGDLGATDRVRTYTLDLSDATKGKLTAVGNLANVIGGTTIAADGTVTGPTFNITNATGGTDTANTLKDAIDKLNKTNEGQNTTISNLTTTVTNNYNDLSTKITNAGAAATNALTEKGLDFYGNKDAAETDKVHRNLGQALKVKGAENFTREATATNNIDVVKNTAGDGFDVKLAENLGNIKEIAGDGTHDLVIKNGDTKVTVKAPKDGNKGSIDFGDTKLVTNNLDANISYKAGTETDKKTVKLQDGFNFVAGTGTVVPKHLEAGTTSPTEATDSVEPKKGIAISTAANGVVNIGLDSDTRGAIDNAADKNLSNLSETGNNKITNLAKAAAKETVKVADGINTTVDTDTTTTEGVTTYKVNANDTKVAITGDGLTISGGELGATDRVRTYTLDLSDATKGKLTAVGNLANVIGGTTIAADGTVTGPTFNITNATGGTDTANTLKDAIDKLNKTNEGQNTTISDLTTTVTNNYNDLSTKITNAGTAATAAATAKGLNFTGDDTTDNGKVHRDLGDTLTIKGGENFARGASENNIKVVKTSNDLAVKLAENLGNIKEISGDGTHDLVIKNGDTKVTVKAPKDGNKGSIDFGDTKLVTNNLDANIFYKAGTETDKKTVKLQDGFNFVAGTGTVVPKHLEAGTTSPTEATDSVEPKKGIAISTAANGVVNIGLDSDTRGAIDNASNQDLSNLTTAGKKVITDAAQGSVKVAAGKNVTIDTETKDNVTTYTVNANDTLVTSDNTLVTVNGGTLGEDKVRTYTLGLSTAVTDKLAQLSAKNADGRDGKLGSETDAIASKDIAKADGLNGETATYKVNALRHGEAGSVVYTDADGNRIVKATDGNYYKATEVNANGVVKTPAENNGVAPVAVEKATIVATLVNTNGTTAPEADDTNKVATTKLTNIKEAAITATSNDAVTGRQLYGLKSDLATYLGGDSKVNADGTFTGPTYNITKDDGTNTTDPVKNVGDAITKLDTRINNANTTLSTKGLDFYGNKDAAETDKVHRNLGEALKVKGAENFTREATAKNNIDVVKNATGDGFDVKLAENLGNIKEIAGNGTDNLVIKNGDATITVKPGKAGSTDPDTGTVTPPTNPSVDFGNTTLVVKNIEADITYRANNAEDADAHTVKLKKGLNFVAGTGTAAPKHLEAGTTSPTATTDSVEPKKGIVISTGAKGVVNIGLDNDTRSAIDNAANQDLSNLTTAGKKVITDAAQGAVKVAAGNNITVDTETKDNVTKYTVNGRDTIVKAAENGSVSVTGGTLNDKGEREYTVDLTDATKAQINRIDGIDTRLTTAEKNITTLQVDMKQAKQDITTLQGDMIQAKTDITTLQGDMKQAKQDITNNTNNIATNTQSIKDNKADIEKLKGNSANKDLSNLTNAGKDVVTGLVNVVGTNGITVTDATDTVSRVKTFTAKLDDKVTFGQGDKQITVDGTTGTITAPNATINVVNTNTVQVGDTNKTNTAVTPEGVTVTTKQPDGTVTSTVIIKDGTVSGLTNTKWDPTKVTDADRSKAATQGQMKDVSDTLQKGRVFAADTGVASTTVALGDTLAIKGGAEGKLIDGNIGVELTEAKGNIPATMMIRLKKDVDMQGGSTSYDHYMDIKGKSVKVATTKVDGTGVTITPVKGLDKPSVTLTADGLDNGGNAIHNVGPGTAPNDAATVGQVSAAAGTLSRRVNEVGAHAAALAAMNPLSYDPLKKSQVMAGYGSYKGNSALALGVAHYANEDTLFNVGVSVGNGENMVNAGVTYRFGGEDSMIPERYKGGPISSVYVMQDEITALKAENARKDVENAKKEAENEEMKAQIKMLIERVTMLEAKK